MRFIAPADSQSQHIVQCRLVTEAQSREAPVQRLADKVAGWFCYGVMTASAATFSFWYLLGMLSAYLVTKRSLFDYRNKGIAFLRTQMQALIGSPKH